MKNQTKMALIDVAFDIMKNGSSREVIDFRVIFAQVADVLGLTEEERTEKITQFYTDLNIDGRFMCTPEKQWGLKSWFLVEQIDEEIVSTTKSKKKKSKISDEDFDSIEDIEREEYSFEDDIEDEADEDDDADEDVEAVQKDESELDALADSDFEDDEDEEGDEVDESLEELASEELDEEDNEEEDFE